jgi:hypothetical protein
MLVLADRSIVTPSVLKYEKSKSVLSQTILSLTKFKEKNINIYCIMRYIRNIGPVWFSSHPGCIASRETGQPQPGLHLCLFGFALRFEPVQPGPERCCLVGLCLGTNALSRVQAHARFWLRAARPAKNGFRICFPRARLRGVECMRWARPW